MSNQSKPSPIGSLGQAIAQVGELLQRFESEGAHLGDPAKTAIRAVWRAVDQTRLHLAAIRAGHMRQDTPKQELADLWSTASLAILEVDPDFADRLRRKAEYWTDPMAWHDEPGVDISIDSVANTARDLLGRATHSLPADPQPQMGRDLFVCHAREDKDDVVRPLVASLRRFGYEAWLDEDVLQLGDSLRVSIDAGLAQCRYGVVVLSPSFFAKAWPQSELNGLIALEMQDGRKRVLPIWHRITAAEIAKQSPLLADRLGVSTDLGMDVVVSQVIDVLEEDDGRR